MCSADSGRLRCRWSANTELMCCSFQSWFTLRRVYEKDGTHRTFVIINRHGLPGVPSAFLERAMTGMSPMPMHRVMAPLAWLNSSPQGRKLISVRGSNVTCAVAPESGTATMIGRPVLVLMSLAFECEEMSAVCVACVGECEPGAEAESGKGRFTTSEREGACD